MKTKTNPKPSDLTMIEYWFDDDSDAISEKKLTQRIGGGWGSGEIVQLEEIANTTALLDGIHRLNYRVRDDKGNWSQIVTAYFLKQTNRDTNDLEYLWCWWDDDLDNKSLYSYYGFAQLGFFDASVLPDGFHRLNYNVQDICGNLSQTIAQVFIKTGDQYNEPESLSYNGRTYQVFDTQLTWRETEGLCVRLGGRLASVTQEADTEFLQTLLSDEKYAHVNYFWLGGIDKNGSAEWE